MSIKWFGGFSRYQLSGAGGKLPTTRAAMPFPSTPEIRLRHNGANANWSVKAMANVLEAGSRNWLQVTSETSRNSISSHFFELGLFSRDIPDEYKKLDTVICTGFRFRLGVPYATTKYLCFGLLDETVNLNTAVANKMKDIVYPLHAEGKHPLTTMDSQEKYIEFRVRYREDDKCLIKVYVNKDLVLERIVSWDQEWAILTGCPIGSETWYSSQSSTYATSRRGTVCYNDLYLGIDEAGDLDPSGLVGPVTVKALELESVEAEGTWLSSAPGETVQQTVGRKIANNTPTMSNNFITTDPGDKAAKFKFLAPVEPLRIVAFQQDFIAQQPIAYSTSLQYERKIGDLSLEANQRKVTKNITLEPGIERVTIPAMSLTHDGKMLTPEYIASVTIDINSTMKQIEDDEVFIPEDEIIEIPAE